MKSTMDWWLLTTSSVLVGLFVGPYVKICCKHIYYKVYPPRKRKVLEFVE